MRGSISAGPAHVQMHPIGMLPQPMKPAELLGIGSCESRPSIDHRWLLPRHCWTIQPEESLSHHPGRMSNHPTKWSSNSIDLDVVNIGLPIGLPILTTRNPTCQGAQKIWATELPNITTNRYQPGRI